MSSKLSALVVGLIAASIAFAAEPASTYEGEYFYNFENAKLTPKGQTECWALKGDMSAAELPGKNGTPPWGTAYVVVRGTLSDIGHYGNLGACTRLLTVLAIVKVRDKVQR